MQRNEKLDRLEILQHRANGKQLKEISKIYGKSISTIGNLLKNTKCCPYCEKIIDKTLKTKVITKDNLKGILRNQETETIMNKKQIIKEVIWHTQNGIINSLKNEFPDRDSQKYIKELLNKNKQGDK